MLNQYILRWEQNMGNDRGISVNVSTDDWEVGKLLYQKMIKNSLMDEVRDVKVYHNDTEFDPNKKWPRITKSIF
jgi:hypothetical protein